MNRFILGLVLFLLLATATYYVISYRLTVQENHVQGPGLGWNNDYAWYDKSGNFIGIKDKPQTIEDQ